MKKIDCFGFYVGGPVCGSCAAQKRCRAILVSDGFDLAGSLVEELLEAVPEGTRFAETNRVSEMVQQLLKPPTEGALDPETAELLDMLE